MQVNAAWSHDNPGAASGSKRLSRLCCFTAVLLSAMSLAFAADSPLANAARTMDREAVRVLIDQSADVNAAQVDGMTALHWVCLHDDLEMARLLVETGADVNSANRYGVTPLTLACTNGNGALVELLLDAGADPNSSLPGGETALMTASRTGRVEPVKALLVRGADVHRKVHGMGRHALAGAGAFLIRLADPTIFDFETKPEQTALTWAAAEGHAEVVVELIKAGADFRTTLSSGFTPLLFAVRNGHTEVVKTLVTAGADINRRIDPHKDWRHRGYGGRLRPGATALHLAVENGQFELAAHLLDIGADANAADPIGYTALHAVSGSRRVSLGDADPPPEPTGGMTSLEFVRELAAHGANLNARLKGPGMINIGSAVYGPTAFLAAAQTADVDYLNTLIDLGADPHLRDRDNSTALMMAGAKSTSVEDILQTIGLLLDLGVDIDAVDANGETAMHAAAYNDRPEPIKLLAAKGARIEVWNRKNKYGATPLAIATGYRRPGSFRPQPRAEAAIREVMIAAGVAPPEKVTLTFEAKQGY
ncbi:MAG: ankyrin repeat domain-containing protein [Bryobacterales bacterium]|nr:ankyrin repeat domain-containing protein [Bryobacterales bacterium]